MRPCGQAATRRKMEKTGDSHLNLSTVFDREAQTRRELTEVCRAFLAPCRAGNVEEWVLRRLGRLAELSAAEMATFEAGEKVILVIHATTPWGEMTVAAVAQA